jgi:hypothetical protein
MRKPTPRPRKEKSENTPGVGIFFAVGPKLWIDATPLSQGGIYGEFKIHERGHEEYWAQLVAAGSVPVGSEYDNYPRGRVAYNERTQKYSLLADRCIVRDKERVAEIIKRMHLPAELTKTATDQHYQCPECLRKEG